MTAEGMDQRSLIIGGKSEFVTLEINDRLSGCS